MKQIRESTGKPAKRVLVVALAAVLVLALAVGALAASGIFNMKIRDAETGERFYTDFSRSDGSRHYWDGAKLVFSFDGPSECNRIRFRPAYMPYQASQYFSSKDGDGWYTCISCEGGSGGGRSNQPCRIDVRYAPMFVDGGNLLLLYADDVGEIAEEEWNGYRITKFQSHKANLNFPNGKHDVNYSYFIMYQPEAGHIITLSSMEDNLDELAQIARGLEIEQTNEIVSSADWHEHSEFLDCGVG